MTIYLTLVSDHGSGADLRRLRRWLDVFFATNPTFAAVYILTDNETLASISKDVPMVAENTDGLTTILGGFVCNVVDPAPFSDVMRPGNPCDRRAAIVLAALETIGPALILDPDYDINVPLIELMSPIANSPIAMLEYAGPIQPNIPWEVDGRRIYVTNNDELAMAFMDPRPGIREAIVADYRKAWHWLAEHDSSIAGRGYRAARSWSLVHHWAEGSMIRFGHIQDFNPPF